MPDIPTLIGQEQGALTHPNRIIVEKAMSFHKQLVRKAGRAVYDYKMIREGDRIAVGVSGGKVYPVPDL